MRKKLFFVPLGFLILILICAGVFAVLFANGKFYAGFKNSAQKVVVETRVCDEAVFKKYEDSLKNTEVENLQPALKKIISDINSRKDNEKDPNCQFILYNANYYMMDYAAALKSAENLRDLNAAGHFIDGDAPGGVDVASMVEYMKGFAK